MDVRIEELRDIEALGRTWRTLEQRAETSYFVSWGWIGSWLRLISQEYTPYVLVAESHDEVVGLAVFVVQDEASGRTQTSCAYLHETGEPKYHMTVEYNGFLLKSKGKSEIAKECLGFLIDSVSGWDELVFSGVRKDDPLFVDSSLRELPLEFSVVRESPCWIVDLATIRRVGQDYMMSVTRHRRSQLRRALKRFEHLGPVRVREADSMAVAQEFFDRLKSLHQKSWTGRDEPGSFANPNWELFHRTIIRDRFKHGEIQMLAATAGREEIGYVYSLAMNGWINVIQSGFNYGRGPVFHPGYVTHLLAIEHNLRKGALAYDFLAGDSRYKRSLSGKRLDLRWIRSRRR